MFTTAVEMPLNAMEDFNDSNANVFASVDQEIIAVAGVAIDAKQRVPYLVGVSAKQTGAQFLSMQLVTLPPGGSCRPHIHVDSESALFIMSRDVETLFGKDLAKSVISHAGDFIFISAGVPHQGRNLSDTEPAIAVVARNDADEQERVVPYSPR